MDPRPDPALEALLSSEPQPAGDEVAGHPVPTRREFEERLLWKSRGIEGRIARAVVGQEVAVAAVARAVRRAAAGLGSAGRPLANLLFLGRTGTGKTLLAKTLARELFDGRRSLVRVDCGEYALPHEHARLIGSPPGFVGHEAGGGLVRALAEDPARVVLFDEIEKAHPRMHGLLLSILDEGSLTDGRGKRVSFDRSVVVLTSNAGAKEMAAAARPLGFAPGSDHGAALGPERLEAIAREALERRFSPEFLGRIDETVLFRELDLDAAEAIARLELRDLAVRARRAGRPVVFRPEIARWIAERGFSAEHGARGIAHAVRREIEAPLAELVLREKDGASPVDLAPARARVEDDRIVFER
jgi:ATP-dependent Clp protease ATP-binding subunit ClpC